MTHADAPLPQAATRRARWVGRVSYFALPLFLTAIAALVWLTRQYDADEQRSTLISDVLWMEQNLRFEIDRNEADLQQLGPDLFAPRLEQQTEARLAHLLTQGRGLVRILWRNPDGALVGAMPPLPAPDPDEAADLSLADTPFQLARNIGRPTYGPPYPGSNGKHRFEVHIPVWSDNASKGVVTGIYSLNDIVVRDLPWWFSTRYRVAVLDGDGREIAAKSKVAPLSPQLDYRIPFEPPGHGLSLQITAYKPDTRWIPLLLTASIVILGGAIVWSVRQLRRQLARRQQAEVALRAESAFRKAMEDSMLTGMRARDLDGRLTYVNSAFCRITGYSADELVGLRPPLPYWLPNHIEQRQELLDRLEDIGSTPDGVELRFRRKNGEMVDVLLFEAPLIDASGRQAGWMGSVLDITEQKRAHELTQQQEERLQATSRLITMGEMASTLAHELNQPLTAIASYADGCLHHLQATDTDRDELLDIQRKIGRQARRAGEIIRRVHDFVRRSEPRLDLIDLNTVVRDAASLIEADVRKRRMQLVLDLAPALPPVKADAVMIEQIVVNLVRNGMDAMRDTSPADRKVHVATRLEGHSAIVQVTDHGCGIPADTAARLFEPFFTTKTEGIGMGLNICRSIAELHHGRLTFDAAPGGGTIFTLTLPVENA